MTTPTVVASEFVTITVAAARACRCEDTIRNWLAAGRLQPYRLLGRTVVKSAELDALLARESAAQQQPAAPVAS